MKLDLRNESDDLVVVENAIVMPPPAHGRGRIQASGVLTENGEFIENSISWSSSESRVNEAPELPADDVIAHLPGTWMFGGVLFGHFGHFIVESMARVWGIGQISDRLDGVIFTPKQIGGNIENVLKVQRPLMSALGMDLPAICPLTPTRVDRLYVPRQGFGMTDLTHGSDKFRDYMLSVAGKKIAPAGPERIYISRSTLPPNRGGLVGEMVLEQLLEADGYSMYHPQRQPQEAQIAQYKAARDIISVDCSPLHLTGYVGNSNQRIAIITRRSMGIANSMVEQITTFTGADAFEVNTLLRDWVPGAAHRPGRSSFGEIDFPRTYEVLKARGMVSSDTPWPPLSDEQIAADLTRIEETHGIKFRALEDSSQPVPPTNPANS